MIDPLMIIDVALEALMILALLVLIIVPVLLLFWGLIRQVWQR